MFVCPVKLLSCMSLSEGIPFKTCANPQARNREINRANLYENEMVLNISRFKLFGSISYNHLVFHKEVVTFFP